MPLILARNRVIICLLFLTSILPATVGPVASAQSGSSGPVLSIAAAVAPPSSLIAVIGEGFSPGGLVYIAVYDHWGVEVHEHLWTVARHAAYGPHGSQDPALGYAPSGYLNEVIDLFPATVYGPHGSQDPTQGYSGGAEAVFEPGAIYGPNGSQDPAQGYVPAGDQTQAGVACGHDLMVRAYDQQAGTWSNLVDVAGTC